MVKGMQQKCTNNEECEITRFARNSCQFCRLKKCVRVGMSRSGKRRTQAPIYELYDNDKIAQSPFHFPLQLQQRNRPRKWSSLKFFTARFFSVKGGSAAKNDKCAGEWRHRRRGHGKKARPCVGGVAISGGPTPVSVPDRVVQLASPPRGTQWFDGAHVAGRDAAQFRVRAGAGQCGFEQQWCGGTAADGQPVRDAVPDAVIEPCTEYERRRRWEQ